MKTILAHLAIVVSLALATVCIFGLLSCASLTLDQAKNFRPAAAVAAASYIAAAHSDAAKHSRAATLEDASIQVHAVALSENPTAEALALALSKLTIDPQWQGVVASLVATYTPATSGDLTGERAALLAIAQGLDDVAKPFLSGQ